MRRLAFSLVAMSALYGAAAPSPVAAQAFNSNATVYLADDRSTDKDDKLDNNAIVYINAKQCLQTFTFALQGYSTPVPYLEMWVTNNPSINCADAANRSSPTNTMPTCWPVGKADSNVNGKTSFSVSGTEIFNATDRNETTQCDPNVQAGKYKVQFVTLDSTTQMNTATVTASNNNPNKISATFTLYSELPAAPAVNKVINGETSLGINYDRVNNDPLTRYRGFFFRGAQGGLDAGGGCDISGLPVRAEDGGLLAGNMLNVDNVNVFQTEAEKGTTATLYKLDEKGIALGEYLAVSVAAVDAAGNLGQLSQPECVQRVPVTSFYDLCTADGGLDCGELDTCSLSSKNSGGALALSALVLALSAWRRRPRRSN